MDARRTRTDSERSTSRTATLHRRHGNHRTCASMAPVPRRSSRSGAAGLGERASDASRCSMSRGTSPSRPTELLHRGHRNAHSSSTGWRHPDRRAVDAPEMGTSKGKLHTPMMAWMESLSHLVAARAVALRRHERTAFRPSSSPEGSTTARIRDSARGHRRSVSFATHPASRSTPRRTSSTSPNALEIHLQVRIDPRTRRPPSSKPAHRSMAFLHAPSASRSIH